MRIALAFESGRDGFWLDLWRVLVLRKRPEYPVERDQWFESILLQRRVAGRSTKPVGRSGVAKLRAKLERRAY